MRKIIKTLWVCIGIPVGMTITVMGLMYLLLWGTGEKGIMQ